MGRGLCLELSRRDRHRLDELLSGGLQPVRTVLRALALRQMDDGQSTPAVGVSLGLSAKAVWQIAKRYQQGGLDRALFDGARPGKAPALDQEQRTQNENCCRTALQRIGDMLLDLLRLKSRVLMFRMARLTANFAPLTVPQRLGWPFDNVAGRRCPRRQLASCQRHTRRGTVPGAVPTPCAPPGRSKTGLQQF